MFRRFRSWVHSSDHPVALVYEFLSTATPPLFSLSALPTTMAIFTYVIVFGVTRGGKPSESFYETAGQVIAVLLLALALERRLIVFSRLPHEYWEARSIRDALAISGPALPGLARLVYGIATILALAVGEAFALAPLISGDLGSGHVRPVVAAIGAGFVAILGLAIVPRPMPSAQPKD